MSEKRDVTALTLTKGWLTVEAGCFTRGQVRREIEVAAWQRGLDIETEESKGLLESSYRFTVKGPAEKVERFMADCKRWLP